MKSKILIIILAVILVLLPSFAYADDEYPIKTAQRIYDGGIWGGNMMQGTDSPKLVRAPSGRLYHVGHWRYGSAQEIYLSYSDDNGLNWADMKLTNVGHDQTRPAIAMSSNQDLHIAWCGKGWGGDTDSFGLVYMHYDYSEEQFSDATEIFDSTDSSGVGDIQLMVDSNDAVHIIFAEADGNLYITTHYMNREYDADSDSWGSWSSPEEVIAQDSVGGEARCGSISAAIDKDNYIAFFYVESAKFYIRNPSTGSWANEAVPEAGGGYPSLMASISGGNTVWHVLYRETDATHSWLRYNYRQSGSWGSEQTLDAMISSTYHGGTALAQCHGVGSDTGDIYAFYSTYKSDYPSHIYYREKSSGSWGSEVDIEEDGKYGDLSATKELWPSSGTWHWNLPQNAAVLTYAGSTDSSWNSAADDYYEYFLLGISWGEFPPYVTTNSVTDITESTATVTGQIWGTSVNCTVIGAQYGHTQTPTWAESESGNYTIGTYEIDLVDLESDEIYYTRIYATNSAGTSYGDWIGFLASQPSYDEDEITDDSGLTPPNPDEPGGWIRPPKDWGDFNGIPWTFIAFLFIAGSMTATGLLITSTTRNVIVLFGVLGFIMAIFCILPRGGYLDWWVMFPYFIVGWALIKRDQQAPMG